MVCDSTVTARGGGGGGEVGAGGRGLDAPEANVLRLEKVFR